MRSKHAFILFCSNGKLFVHVYFLLGENIRAKDGKQGE
jgi:hypothetical protein